MDNITSRDKEVGLACFKRACKLDAHPEDAVTRMVAEYRSETLKEAADRADEWAIGELAIKSQRAKLRAAIMGETK